MHNVNTSRAVQWRASAASKVWAAASAAADRAAAAMSRGQASIRISFSSDAASDCGSSSSLSRASSKAGSSASRLQLSRALFSWQTSSDVDMVSMTGGDRAYGAVITGVRSGASWR